MRNDTTPDGLWLPDGSLHRFGSARQERAALLEHVASRQRSIDATAWAIHLPNPDPVLRKLGRAESAYRDLKSDAHVAGSIRRRKAAVQGMERRVVPVPTGNAIGRPMRASATAMRLAQDALAGLDLSAVIAEILEATLFGYQPMEVLWRRVNGGRWMAGAVQGKPQEWFFFAPDNTMRFRSASDPVLGEEIAPRKFLLPRQDATYANPYGFADLSACFWPVTFKRGGLKFWAMFGEKFGMPWIVGKQPRGTGKPETDRLLSQLEAMVQDAVCVIPDDASVDIKEAASKGDAAGAYERFLMFCRSEVSIALLGQNQSTEAEANRASATAGLEVTRSLRDADARLVESTINTLLRWVTDLNIGVEAPSAIFELYEEQEVSEVQAKRDEALSRAGVVFTPQYWARTYSLQSGDIAAAGASTRPFNPAATPPAGDGPSFAEPTGVTDPDAIDDLIADELAGDGWRRVAAPLVDPLQALLDRAAREGWTAQRLIDALPAALQKMDPAPLADSLTRAAIVARLAANAGIPPRDEPGGGEGAA